MWKDPLLFSSAFSQNNFVSQKAGITPFSNKKNILRNKITKINKTSRGKAISKGIRELVVAK